MRNNVSERVSWKPLFVFGVLSLILAYVVNKEISLPLPAIVMGGILGGAALFFSTLFYPEIPFYVLVAYLPFSRTLQGNFGGLMTALNLMNILCLLAIFGYMSPLKKEKVGTFPKSALNFAVFLFALVGAISLIRGSWEYGAWYMEKFIIPLKRWLTPIFLYFLTLLIVRDRRTLKTVVLIIMIAVAVVGLLTIKEHIDIGQVGSIEKERVGGIAEQPNMLAAFFCYYMFLFGSFFLCNSTKPRYWLLLVPMLICFRGIQVTFSRGGYLSFFAGGLALSFFRSKILFVFTIFALVIALMNPILLPQGIVYRLLSTFKNVEQMDEQGRREIAAEGYEGEEVVLEGSSRGRLIIWKGALKIIADYPFWGTGYGTFGAVIPFYAPELRGRRMDAHNSYIIIAAEMGIPALLIFLWVLSLIIWKTYRLYKTAKDPFLKATALGFLAGLFGVLMANMFGSRLHHEEISGYFWILSALMLRGLLFETSTSPELQEGVGKVKTAVRTLPIPVPAVARSRSISSSLRRLDKMKYGVKE
ncbi:MAG: O-antigen ligase family protein [Candidatus Omnitrophica bacterium]|nr:O-antigen ligase family protein [Candidatus Omnitrophota bacterium]